MLAIVAVVDLATALALLAALHPVVRGLDPWLAHANVASIALGFGLAAGAEILASTDPVHQWLGAMLPLVGRVLFPLLLATEVVLTGASWTPAMTAIAASSLFAFPLYLVLRRAWRDHVIAGEPLEGLEPSRLAGYLAMAENQDGDTLDQLSRQQPLLLVFLRHFGCTFCKEALGDLSRRRPEIEAAGARIVLVHMSGEDRADEYLHSFGLQSLDRVADTECDLYRAFGLGRGSWNQLFGAKVWLRAMGAALFEGHWVSALEGDGFRMPGVFVVQHNRVTAAFRHERASSRPNYLEIVRDSCAATDPLCQLPISG
jgi:hypothetical protein